MTRATNDADRDKAFALARSFSQRLPTALEELPRDCACLVVLKSAVAGRTPQTVDLTALLQQKLGHPQTPHRNDPDPDGHFKFPHLWPLKLPQAGRSDYGFPAPV